MRVAVAFDHRGVKLRERVLEEVPALGHELIDLGADAAEPAVDYPDKAREVGDAIRSGEAERGILVIGSGVVGADMAGELVRAFLAAEFDGGERYRRRLEKIEAMEREGASA